MMNTLKDSLVWAPPKLAVCSISNKLDGVIQTYPSYGQQALWWDKY